MNQKTIIITGAHGNLGRATVDKFQKLDFNVVAVVKGKNNNSPKDNVHYVENCDLSLSENAQRVLNETLNVFSPPSILLNIAGGFIWKEIQDTTYSDIEDQFIINFKTMFNMTKAVLPYIVKEKKGHIINIGAIGAVNADRGMAAYSISKSAVMRFTEALAIETPDNVTVNIIMPSIIDTPQNRNDMPDADFSKWQTLKELTDQIEHYCL